MLLHPVPLVLHDAGDKFLLGGKEVVKGALAQPGGLGDLLHRGVGHAILLDKLEARVQHFDTQLLPIGDTENFR